MSRLIECVPNFSEGNDMSVIKRITDAIETVDGVELLDVDPGRATNRTVVTFVGAPEAVIEAAVRGVRVASELIDMSQHQGEHPRFGATDVCPLVPVAGITMQETVTHARELARRLGEEVGLSVFCYENAALDDGRKNLADVRAGEYEGLEEKLADPSWKPDFGPATFNARSGATAVSARDFLIAYNVNLNTTSTRRANAIAFDVREKGRIKRTGDPLTGEIVRDESGEPVWVPGTLESVKAIGWYIEEYGVAQISMNLTNIKTTPIHVAFDEVCDKARARGIRVIGSELVGLIPLEAMLDAAEHYLRKQKRSLGISEREMIKIAVKSLGLDDLAPFDPDKKIIEYVLRDDDRHRLIDLAFDALVHRTASESPAPGGGSVAAAVGALGAALGTMVANLSAHKRGWDDRWEEFSDWAVKGKLYQERLLELVDADTDAFNEVLAAFRLANGTDQEKRIRRQAVEAATRGAIEVPLEVMEASLASMEVMRAMVEEGLKSSLSDAAVGALCARTAVLAAYMNVRINTSGLEDKALVDEYVNRGSEMQERAIAIETEVRELVDSRL